MNTIDPEVKATLSKYRDVRRLWETLKSRFAMVNGPRIQQLKSFIAKFEQPKTMSVASYFGKLTALWEELNTYEPLITCSCCDKCIAGQEHEKRRENTRLHQFLMGLYADSYSKIRANILSQDPLPSLGRAYQLLIQDERVRLAKTVSEDKPPEAVGFAVRASTGRGISDSSGTTVTNVIDLINCTWFVLTARSLDILFQSALNLLDILIGGQISPRCKGGPLAVEDHLNTMVRVVAPFVQMQ